MYKYGASFNCQVRTVAGPREDIGGGGEGNTTLDYVGNDVQKIAAAITETQMEGCNYTLVTENHSLIGGGADVGQGPVVGVIIDQSSDVPNEEDDHVVCVIFEGPTLPVIVE